MSAETTYQRLDCDPSLSTAAQEWKHWLKTFENFLGALSQENIDKLGLLTNFVSPKIYETISECTAYDSAIEILKSQYVKPTNEVFAHHHHGTRSQQAGESLDEYLQALKILSKDCNFKAITAVQYCEESIRDAFISGVQSPAIRQRLLENKTLDLSTMFDQARALDSAQRNSEMYGTQPSQVVSIATPDPSTSRDVTVESAPVAAAVGAVVSSADFHGIPAQSVPHMKQCAINVRRKVTLPKCVEPNHQQWLVHM
ncbi:uncharacterized protein LOC143021835 [Oratosquilla oratoria]|uniref:uncharacterized protein LOC143021835 n=1 Tax=Oratosquilla oratoria TaxID=337810 RepID=UPI003F770DBC